MNSQQTQQYVIGIDLGTTNIVVAYGALSADEPLQLLAIPQLVGPGQVKSLTMLPAVRYHYGNELQEQQVALPWATDKTNKQLPQAVIGQWALELGAKTPARFINSAKSWLSYRSESSSEISLPYGTDPNSEIETCTPLEATSGFLAYVQAAWNSQFPKNPFIKQQIVITVPASFDDVARALTIEATKRIGVDSFKLLEEPQAACYRWLAKNDARELDKHKTLMVCDIGGGTSDFTLISVESRPGDTPKLKRIGVGEHLMLGGDNMDLALAARVQQKLGEKAQGHKALLKLLPQCQQAKEQLLSENAPEELRIQLASAGSSLMGGIQETRLTAKEAEQLLLDGFFPLVAQNATPKKRQATLAEIGLPYPSDPAISRHVAAFLHNHQSLISEEDSELSLPDAWLLNGGPFQSRQVQDRLSQLIDKWSSNSSVSWLNNQESQTAVAYGAAHYARKLANKETVIDSAVARHYFLKITSDAGDKGLCILPKNTPLHEPQRILERTFNLTCGQDVQFDVASSLEDDDHQLGQLIDWHERLHTLPALTTHIDGSGTVPVTLSSELDELGVLQVSLQQKQNNESYLLHFNLRNTQNQDIAIHPKLNDALSIIEQWYGSASKNAPKLPLKKSLEKLLGTRETWSVHTARSLFDKLMALAKRRRRSAAHERSWFNIAGYCLRPGIGYVGDNERIEQVWKLYEPGVQHHTAEIYAQWWAFWRRAAAGLTEQQQLVLYADINHVTQASRRKQGGKIKIQAASQEKIRLLGALERLPTDIKETTLQQIGRQLIDSKLGQDMCWCAGRLLNRKLMYGAPRYTISGEDAEKYLPALLSMDWKEHPDLAFVAVSVAKVAPDESLNLPKDLTEAVKDKLSGNLSSLKSMLDPEQNLSQSQMQQLWGDALPSGLSL